MGSFNGADAVQLTGLSNRMNAAAESLGVIRSSVGSVVERLVWTGLDAEQFFDEWSNQFSGMLGRAISGLQTAASDLSREAQQQEWASGDYEPGIYGTLWLAARVAQVGGAIADGIEKSPWESKVKGMLPEGVEVSKIGGVLTAAEFALNVSTLVTALHGDDKDKTDSAIVDTAISGVGTVAEGVVIFGAAAGASAALVSAAAVVAPVTAVAGLADWGIDSTIDPKLNEQIVDGVKDAGKFVIDGDIDEVKGAAGVAEAAGSVLSSGVHGAESLLDRL